MRRERRGRSRSAGPRRRPAGCAGDAVPAFAVGHRAPGGRWDSARQPGVAARRRRAAPMPARMSSVEPLPTRHRADDDLAVLQLHQAERGVLADRHVVADVEQVPAALQEVDAAVDVHALADPGAELAQHDRRCNSVPAIVPPGNQAHELPDDPDAGRGTRLHTGVAHRPCTARSATAWPARRSRPDSGVTASRRTPRITGVSEDQRDQADAVGQPGQHQEHAGIRSDRAAGRAPAASHSACTTVARDARRRCAVPVGCPAFRCPARPVRPARPTVRVSYRSRTVSEAVAGFVRSLRDQHRAA